MSGINPRARLVRMIQCGACSAPGIRHGEILDRVAKRHPRLALGRKQTAKPSDVRAEASWRPRRGSETTIPPIPTRYPLVVKQPIQGVGRRGEAPFHPKIASEPNDEDALPHLWHPEIRGVQQAGGDLITNPILGVAAVDLPKGRQVRLPAFLRSLFDLGMGELKLQVGEVVSKRGSREAPHVLKKKRSRVKPANGANELRNHVAAVAHASVLAPDAEGLARRAASDEIDLAEALVRKLANIGLDDIPICDSGNRPLPRVEAQGRAGVAVPLDEGRVAKSPMMSAQGQASGTRKQLKGPESVFLQIDPSGSGDETRRVRDG